MLFQPRPDYTNQLTGGNVGTAKGWPGRQRAAGGAKFVLDASTVLTWCFQDEKAQKAQKISERIAGGDTAVVPAFCPHEVLNALAVDERRNRLTPELTEAFTADLNRLPVDVDVAMHVGMQQDKVDDGLNTSLNVLGSLR